MSPIRVVEPSGRDLSVTFETMTSTIHDAGASRQRVNTSEPCSDRLPLFLTAGEAADLLRTTRKAIYVMVERRQLPGITRIGRRVLIRSKSLVDWLDQQGAPSLQEKQR